MGKDIFFTPEELDKIEKEIEYLKAARRKEVAEKVRATSGCGDLSENPEYDGAKNGQAHIEERIVKLGNMVRDARAVKEGEIDEDTVGAETRVEVKDKRPDEEDIFDTVGLAEADPLEGKISNEGPAGVALIGCKIGGVAEVEVLDRMTHCKVVKISF